MHYSRLLLLFASCTLMQTSYAQKENNHWTFGYQNGLDFSSGTPVFFTSSNISVEGSASVSGTEGNLLFYSNGNTVWDAAGNQMPNGGGILGNGPSWQAAGSSTQGVGISRSITNPDQYYLFTLDANEDLGPTNPGYLRYSIVDMSLNSGLGDVVATEKNKVLDSFMSEKMTFVKGGDCSYWLLTHKHNSADYLAFKIDAAGIHPAVKSTTGLPPVSNLWGGEMKASPDGTKLVITGNNTTSFQSIIEVSTFDPATGIVSNTIELDATANITRYGYSFSPDNSKLYVTNSLPSFFTSYGEILQFDLSLLPNVAAVNASRYRVILSTGKAYSGMRMGPDDKLYIAISDASYIARINNPNLAGTACDIDSLALSQPASAQFPVLSVLYGFGLGNDVLSIGMDTILHEATDTILCLNNTATLGADTGYYNYVWDDGSTEREREINAPGTYWVSYSEHICYRHIDTIKVEALKLNPLISVNEFVLSTSDSYSSYQWFLNGNPIPGATESTYTVTENGDYTVAVTNDQGCSDTSPVYTVTNVSIRDVSAIAGQIRLYPNPVQDVLYIDAPVKINVTLTGMEGKMIKQESNVTYIPVKSLASGIYLLNITDQNGNLIKTEKFVKQ